MLQLQPSRHAGEKSTLLSKTQRRGGRDSQIAARIESMALYGQSTGQDCSLSRTNGFIAIF